MSRQDQRKKALPRALRKGAVSVLLALVAPALAQAACVCGTGKMTNWYPGTAPITVNGDMSDWTSIMSNPNNNICDGFPGSAISDLDAPIQSTGRDLEQFTYTFDSAYVYAYTQRYASDTNTDNFIYYADINNDGLMETGEPVIVVQWQGSNRTVGVFVGTYRSYYPGGDSMVCNPSASGSQSCTSGYADGYHLPGTIVNLPPSGHPNYTGQWGSNDGTQMEWKVSWTDLGLGASPGVPFTFHVASTNATPGAGSFPAQVDDNMGGCGGKGGTTQYGGASLTPNQTITLSAATAYTTTHTITNMGNGSDNFTLSVPSITGSNNPTPTVTFLYNGTPFTDTSTLGSGFSIPAGQSLTFTVQYSFPSSPATKSYNVTVQATSKFDGGATSQVVDTLTSQQAITIFNKTVGGYGTFSYSGGTNGLPASLSLTTTAGNNPIGSQGFVVANTTKPAAITESIPAGWLYASGSCAYASTGTPLASGNYSFTAGTGGVTLNVASAAFTGDSINCTFVNNKLPTLKVNKLMGAARVSDADQFTVQLFGGSTLVGSSATTGAGEVVDTGTGTVSYTATTTGVSYSVNETKSAGPTPSNVYAAVVSCTNNDAPVSTPNALGQPFTPGIGDNYICWITNTPPLLTILKRSYSGTGAFSFTGTNGVSSSFSLDTSTANPVAESFVLSAANTQTTVSETGIPSGWSLTNATCVDSTNNTVATTLSSGTLIIPGSAVVAGKTLTCTFTNVFQPSLQITKTVDPTQATPGQVVTYTVNVSNYAGAATGVVLADSLSPYVAFGVNSYGSGAPFYLTDGTGAAASGLALGTPLYSKNNGASWDYTPSATGFDPNVTNWKLPLIGTMNGWAGTPNPYPTFTINYKVQTK